MGTTHFPFRNVILATYDNGHKQKEVLSTFFQSIPDNLKDYVIEPILLMNNYITIQFIPSGSKSGWNPSVELDELWYRFRELIQTEFEFPTYIDYQFSGDMKKTIINETTDNIIDVGVSESEELKQYNLYDIMRPVHKLIEKIYNDNPELFIKYSKEISEIITQSGMNDLETDGRILVDEYWLNAR